VSRGIAGCPMLMTTRRPAATAGPGGSRRSARHETGNSCRGRPDRCRPDRNGLPKASNSQRHRGSSSPPRYVKRKHSDLLKT